MSRKTKIWRIRAAALTAALSAFILLYGCSRILETEYSSVSAHTDSTPTPPPDSSARVASSYTELKDAILSLVRVGASEGMVRLNNYVGDAESDVQEACLAISRNEPVGMYALDYLVPSVTQLLSDYEVTFTLYYRRTPEQVLSVEYVNGPTAFRERLAEMLRAFDTELAFETNYFHESEYDFHAILSELYYGAPLLAQGMPELSVIMYPDTGLRRIIEIGLHYPDTLNALRSRATLCDIAVARLIESMPGPDGAEPYGQALWLYQALGAACEFDWELYLAMTDGLRVNSSVYDALCIGRSLPEGYALAFKALCDAAQIECRVVRGLNIRAPGAPLGAPVEHFWNLIELDGHWYHVDLSADAMNDSLTYRNFLLDDSVMLSLEYIWDGASLPAADGPLSNHELVIYDQIPETAFDGGEPE